MCSQVVKAAKFHAPCSNWWNRYRLHKVSPDAHRNQPNIAIDSLICLPYRSVHHGIRNAIQPPTRITALKVPNGITMEGEDTILCAIVGRGTLAAHHALHRSGLRGLVWLSAGQSRLCITTPRQSSTDTIFAQPPPRMLWLSHTKQYGASMCRARPAPCAAQSNIASTSASEGRAGLAGAPRSDELVTWALLGGVAIWLLSLLSAVSSAGAM